MAIWYIFPFLVCRTKKNLATLGRSTNLVSNARMANTYTIQMELFVVITLLPFTTMKYIVVLSGATYEF
jgi:hypothetical protein